MDFEERISNRAGVSIRSESYINRLGEAFYEASADESKPLCGDSIRIIANRQILREILRGWAIFPDHI